VVRNSNLINQEMKVRTTAGVRRQSQKTNKSWMILIMDKKMTYPKDPQEASKKKKMNWFLTRI